MHYVDPNFLCGYLTVWLWLILLVLLLASNNART